MAEATPSIPYQKVDKAILDEVHPEIKRIQENWRRVKVLVEEDEAGYTCKEYFPPLPNEDQADQERRKLHYVLGFYNPSQKLIKAKGDYILRSTVERKTENAALQAFIAKADRSGQSLSDFMKNQAAPTLDAYGTVFAVVDKPKGVAVNALMEMKNGMPYLCILDPEQVKTWKWGQDGSLEMFRYCQAAVAPSAGAFDHATEAGLEYVTWTKTEYFRHDAEGNLVEYIPHNFTVVPVAIQSAFSMNSAKTLGRTTFFSASRHIFEGNNLLSKGNFEIARYASKLMIDRMDVDPNEVTRKTDPDTNLKRLESQSAEGKYMEVADISRHPIYLEKDIAVVDKANAQAWMYFQWAEQESVTGQEAMPLAGPQGSPQSGISKAYDFKDVDANLYGFGQDMQAFEMQVLTIVSIMLRQRATFTIKYPESFDARSFTEKVERILSLKKAGYASKTGMVIAQRALTPELTTDEAERATINDELEAAVEVTPPDPNPPVDEPAADPEAP